MGPIDRTSDRWRRAALELGLLTLLYLGYSASRLLASDDPTAAAERAASLLDLQRAVGIAWEHTAIAWVTASEPLGLAASYFYATAHYVVTAAVMLWLYLRGRDTYLPARRTLVLATALALVGYLLLPMAPPRLVGYPDVLERHSADGWWGAEASAPRGLGDLTNQLAAMPSMHAGWALWVAIAVLWAGVGVGWRLLASTYALVTALVVVGTGNHWVLDVIAGWAVVAVAAYLMRPRTPQSSRASPVTASTRSAIESTTLVAR